MGSLAISLPNQLPLWRARNRLSNGFQVVGSEVGRMLGLTTDVTTITESFLNNRYVISITAYD